MNTGLSVPHSETLSYYLVFVPLDIWGRGGSQKLLHTTAQPTFSNTRRIPFLLTASSSISPLCLTRHRSQQHKRLLSLLLLFLPFLAFFQNFGKAVNQHKSERKAVESSNPKPTRSLHNSHLSCLGDKAPPLPPPPLLSVDSSQTKRLTCIAPFNPDPT